MRLAPARYTYDYVLRLLLAGGVDRAEAELIARDVGVDVECRREAA